MPESDSSISEGDSGISWLAKTPGSQTLDEEPGTVSISNSESPSGISEHSDLGEVGEAAIIRREAEG